MQAKPLQSCLTLCDPRQQQTRLLCPWNSPDKNKEYWSGWHFILQGILLTQGSNLRLLCLLHWQAGSLLLAIPACCACMLNHLSCPSLCNPMDTDLQVPFCPWDSPGKNTGVDCHALLQGFFQTWGSNLRLLHLLRCRQVLYPLSHLGST